jgi:hypothetical protein
LAFASKALGGEYASCAASAEPRAFLIETFGYWAQKETALGTSVFLRKSSSTKVALSLSSREDPGPGITIDSAEKPSSYFVISIE